MLKISRKYWPKAALLALTLVTISSCAGQTSDQLTEVPESEAALLDNAEKATPVSDNPSVFADMSTPAASPDNNEKKPAETSASMDALNDVAPAAAGAAAASTPSSDEPFYNPIGGESLGRIAYMLYGDRAEKKVLVEKNPTLAEVATLQAGQPVTFTFDGLKPQPKLLTKDLIDRYPAQLAEKLQGSTSAQTKTTATLEKGETLQSLSQRLYGTTRYWTEIYLLNRDQIPNYDHVKPGIQLSVVERSPANVIAKTEKKAKKVAKAEKAEKAQAPVSAPQKAEAPTPEPVVEAKPVTAPVQAPTPEPVPTPVAATPPPAAAPVPVPAPAVSPPPPAPVPVAQAPTPDPIPETPPAPPPMPQVQNQNQQAKGPVMAATGFFSNSANVRRAVYVVAILLIGATAFFLTRPGKKKNFDMLDVTTHDTASRPKFGRDNDDKKFG